MNNPTLDQLNERRCIRIFTGEAIPDDDLEAILHATRQAPSSINGQQTSLVVIRDPERIARVAELAGGQPQVAGAAVVVVFILDFHRTAEASRLAGIPHVIERSAEGILSGAVDAGIALATFQTAARSFGYGTTPIGGIRKNPDKMIELLGLPPRTYPLVASTLGVPDQTKMPKVKPRIPMESYALAERYDSEAVTAGIEPYDATLRKWWDEQGLDQMRSYIDETATTYSEVYFPTVAATMRAQGFEFADEAS